MYNKNLGIYVLDYFYVDAHEFCNTKLDIKRQDQQSVTNWTELKHALERLIGEGNGEKAFDAMHHDCFFPGWEIEQESEMVNEMGLHHRNWNATENGEPKRWVTKTDTLVLIEKRN